MQRSRTLIRVERERIAGVQTKVSIYHRDPEYAARIRVDHEQWWEVGIDDEAVAELLTTSCRPGSQGVPDWLGVEEVADG